MKSFFSDQAKTTVKNAIVTAESSTSAEVVVTVKPRSSHYREFDYVVGAFFALAMLCGLLFHPAELDENWFPVAVIVAFALGAVVCATFWPLKRALIRKGRLDAEVARAAREAFVRMGIHGTSGRTGMLVYVSAFEKRAELVLDLGLDPAKLGDAFAGLRARIETAASQGDVDRFAQAVAEIGKALEGVLPRSADDVNELPDEVH
jgi:putative membrane protein